MEFVLKRGEKNENFAYRGEEAKVYQIKVFVPKHSVSAILWYYYITT